MTEKIFNKEKIEELYTFPKNMNTSLCKKVFHWVDATSKDHYEENNLSFPFNIGKEYNFIDVFCVSTKLSNYDKNSLFDNCILYQRFLYDDLVITLHNNNYQFFDSSNNVTKFPEPNFNEYAEFCVEIFTKAGKRKQIFTSDDKKVLISDIINAWNDSTPFLGKANCQDDIIKFHVCVFNKETKEEVFHKIFSPTIYYFKVLVGKHLASRLKYNLCFFEIQN